MNPAPASGRFRYERSGQKKLQALRPWIVFLIALSAILFQVYVPLFFQFLSYLELPLLVTLYLTLERRSQVWGIFIGALIGLAQDSLSHHLLGMYGILKTLVGYFAASISLRFDVEHPALRFGLIYFFVLFHQVMYWVLTRTLLGEAVEFEPVSMLLLGFLNALVGVPLYYLFDKLNIRS